MVKKRISAAAMAVALAFAGMSIALPAQAPQSLAQAQQVVKNFKPQHGKIALPEAKATLDLGNAYDFYGPSDARTILVDIWGNPPAEGEGILGLVMLAGKSPLEDNWAAVITYEASGYVSDSDAASTDYSEMLTNMQQGEKDLNEQRQAQGYPGIHVVGWAEQPNYNKADHSVIWARDLQFTDSKVDTLNYAVRTLGRSGVLSLNLISSMPKLGEVKAAAHEFAKHASFDPGARYEDFQAGIDKEAEYGIGGLIAAGAGVAVAKKLGLFAILLKFLKPILLGIVVAFGAFKNKILNLFRREKGPLEGTD